MSSVKPSSMKFYCAKSDSYVGECQVKNIKIGGQESMSCRMCGGKVLVDITSELCGKVQTLRYDLYVLFKWSEVWPLHYSPPHGQDYYCRTCQHGFDRSQIVQCRNSSKKYWYGHGIVMKCQPGQSPKLKEALYCDGIARPVLQRPGGHGTALFDVVNTAPRIPRYLNHPTV